ncbi:MAG: hypothetical protein AB8B73_09835 [Ekhidna sp.]
MEQRDIIKDQIEQLGKVLAAVLAKFLQLKSQGQASQGLEITSQRLQSELDINIERIATLNKDELTEYITDRELTADNLEVLSDYLKEIGIETETNGDQARIRFEKSIELLHIADEISRSASFDRENKKKRIQNLLNGSA